MVKLRNILAIINIILTLSSCGVSQQAFDEMCAKNCELTKKVERIESELHYKDNIMRQTIVELQGEIKRLQEDTTEQR